MEQARRIEREYKQEQIIDAWDKARKAITNVVDFLKSKGISTSDILPGQTPLVTTSYFLSIYGENNLQTINPGLFSHYTGEDTRWLLRQNSTKT